MSSKSDVAVEQLPLRKRPAVREAAQSYAEEQKQALSEGEKRLIAAVVVVM